MENNKAFVLMPFSESLNDVYEFLIKSALSEVGYKVERADDIKSQSNILEDIIKGIVGSDLIVADLTDSNANVYYELGIAHALQKRVVLITQDVDDLPFDLRSYRVVSYSTHFSRMNEAKTELKVLAEEALGGQLPFGNPVKDYGGVSQGDVMIASVVMNNNDFSELGILDHAVDMEESFDGLSEIISIVGSKLVDELTPEIDASTQKLTDSNDMTLKNRRNIIKELAGHIDKYANFLKTKNEDYRCLIKKLETSIEIVLTNDSIDYSNESIDEINDFIFGFESLENGAQQGRDAFLGMLDSVRRLPNMEKSFNSASKYLQKELEAFIDNVDQTIAMSSRALTLGKAILSKVIDGQGKTED